MAHEKLKVPKIRPRTFLKANLQEIVDEETGEAGANKRTNRRNQPRKTQMIFLDVKQKLAEMCQESQEMTKNMEGMVRGMDKASRSSLSGSGLAPFKDESFLRSLNVPQIEEVDEEQFSEDFVRDKAFSLKVKDEIAKCKGKMGEYVELIREMTMEVERVDQENEILCDDLEAAQNKLDEAEEHMEKLQTECDQWNKKFLAVLGELEQSKRVSEEVEEKLDESRKENEQLRRKNASLGEGEVFKDFERLIQENDQLKTELQNVEIERAEVKRQKVDLEENVHVVQDENNDLSEQLQKLIEKKDFFLKKLEKMEVDQEQKQRKLEGDREKQSETLLAKIDQLERENRELTEEVRRLGTRNLELESEINFRDGEENLGLASQLESSKFLMDMTGEIQFGADVDKEINLTDLDVEMGDSGRISLGEGDCNEAILGQPLQEEMFEELAEKRERIENLEKERDRILRTKKEEISEVEEKLIQAQKDGEFKIESMKKRWAHEAKMWKKERKKMTREIKQMEKKLVQLKVQTSNLLVEKDELEMLLSKKIRLLRIKVEEYEKDIRRFNQISKIKNNKGFWDKLFN